MCRRGGFGERSPQTHGWRGFPGPPRVKNGGSPPIFGGSRPPRPVFGLVLAGKRLSAGGGQSVRQFLVKIPDQVTLDGAPGHFEELEARLVLGRPDERKDRFDRGAAG